MSGGAPSRASPTEEEALRLGAGLGVRGDRATVEVRGADRVAYLHRMLTQDVAGLAPMRATYACVLTPRGRVLGDPVVWNLGDRLLLDMAAAAAAAAVPPLERYVIADDVTFTDVTGTTGRLAIAGARAPDALAAVGVPCPEPGAILRASVAGVEALWLRRDLGARPCFEGLLPRAGLSAVVEALAGAPGVRASGAAAWEVARVEEGVPAYGAEVDDRVLPNEAGLEGALSWTKGCYPGQEPVVMARHRGHPPSVLVRLSLDVPGPPARDAALLREARPLGRVTSAVRSSLHGGIVALGYVRHGLVDEGATFDLEGGGTARVLSRAVVAR